MTKEPFIVAVPEDTLIDLRGRLLRTRWPAEIGSEDWRYGTKLGLPRGADRLLAPPLRLAATRGRDQLFSSLPGDHRRATDPFSPPARQGTETAATDPHPRLAMDLLGLPQSHRPAQRSGGIWWRCSRCFRCRRPLPARLRVLGAADTHGHRRQRGHRALGYPHDRGARLPSLRCTRGRYRRPGERRPRTRLPRATLQRPSDVRGSALARTGPGLGVRPRSSPKNGATPPFRAPSRRQPPLA